MSLWQSLIKLQITVLTKCTCHSHQFSFCWNWCCTTNFVLWLCVARWLNWFMFWSRQQYVANACKEQRPNALCSDTCLPTYFSLICMPYSIWELLYKEVSLLQVEVCIPLDCQLCLFNMPRLWKTLLQNGFSHMQSVFCSPKLRQGPPALHEEVAGPQPSWLFGTPQLNYVYAIEMESLR